jgi:hypothetical protein
MKYILAPLPKSRLLDRLAASSTRYVIDLQHDGPANPSTLPLPLSPWAWTKFREKQDGRERLAASLEVLRAVARQDEDHARAVNGRGYSKADSPAGHRLSKLTTSDVSRDGQTEGDVLRLAQRYRRQASSIANPKS